jgi:hypothetical protein
LAVWPMLVFVALNQRMAHISWGRRRLAFDGLCDEVYRALFLPLAGSAALSWLLMAAFIVRHPVGWLACCGAVALWMLAMPLSVWTWFRFRQTRLRLGPVGLSWQARQEAVRMLCLRTLVWAMLTSLFSLGVGAVLLALAMQVQGRLSLPVKMLVGLAGGLGVFAAVQSYAQARLQNLVWNTSGSRYLRFRSKLSVSGFVRLQCRNALLLLLTGGLYWPWAVVATRRMRSHALAVYSRVDVDVLQANWSVFGMAQAGKMAGSPAHRAPVASPRFSSFGHQP